MAVLHSTPLPAARLPHKRQRQWGEVASVLGRPPLKKWRAGVPDDGVLPRLSADTGGEDILDAAWMLSDASLPAPKKRRPSDPDDGDYLALPHAGDHCGGGGEDILDEGCTMLQSDDDIALDGDPRSPKRQRLCAPDDGDYPDPPHPGEVGGREDILEEVDGMPSTVELDLGSVYIPKEGVHPDGEDAHFLSEARNAFGIADGVSGWTRNGVDAGEFARQLMHFCEAELEEEPRGSAITCTRLQGMLQRALARTTARGSSTALIAAVDGRVLRAVNVGDSRFLVVRREEVVYSAPLHQLRFNRPYQLGRVDQCDPPECALSLEVEIEPGDVIVAGSDGLFDNLFDEEVEDVVAKALVDGHGDPHVIARELAWAAVDAYEGGQPTPFTVARSKAGRPRRGGKMDDVTVVVARVR